MALDEIALLIINAIYICIVANIWNEEKKIKAGWGVIAIITASMLKNMITGFYYLIKGLI